MKQFTVTLTRTNKISSNPNDPSFGGQPESKYVLVVRARDEPGAETVAREYLGSDADGFTLESAIES